MRPGTAAHYEGTSGAMAMESPAPGVVLITIEGHDIGEFGSEPMRWLEGHLSSARPVELYIDARRTRGVSMGVSSEWALWLQENRASFGHISMLPGSRFIEITAEFVRRFSGLDGVMRIYTDGPAFDEALASSIAGAAAR